MARLAQLGTILQGCISWRKPAAKSLLEAAQAKHTRSRCSEHDTRGHTELLEKSSDSKSKQGLELCQQGCSCDFSQLCRVQGQTGPREHPVCCLQSGPWHFSQVFLGAGAGSGSEAKPEGRSDAASPSPKPSFFSGFGNTSRSASQRGTQIPILWLHYRSDRKSGGEMCCWQQSPASVV